MSFTLLCHGPDHVQIKSDDGHRFIFTLTSGAKGGKRVTIEDARWCGGQQPQDSFRFLLHAYRYASLCALDCGLA